MTSEPLHAEWTDLLSSYLDEELDPVTRRRVDRHLAECAACRAVLADLQQIVVAAPHYRGVVPGADLWSGIAQAIEADRVRPLPAVRRWLRTPMRQLLAAGVALAAFGIGGWYWLARPTAVTVADAPELAPPPAVEAVPVGFNSAAYDHAIAELEDVLAANRDRLDTATVRVVEQSLRTIDAAIAEARQAIQRDSANAYLNGQIAAHLRKKVAVLKLAARAIGSDT